MKIECPNCKTQNVDFLKIWACGPYIPFKCPNCNTTLIVEKIGNFFWKKSSYLMFLPAGIFLGVMICNRLFDKFYISLFLIALISTSIVDFLFDKYEYQIGKMIVEIKHNKEKT